MIQYQAALKRMQQLPTLLRQKCWELLRACWQWCANGCNNSQQCWDLQCIVGRIQPISLCKQCVMSVRGPNNVGRAVQMDPTLLRYASPITEQKKCWEMLAGKFDQFQTLHNNMQQIQQGVQTDATCNNQQCCVRLHRASPQIPPTNCRPFNPQYLQTNSPNWCLYISIKNKLREFDKRLKHFLPADYFINSHNLFTCLCIDIV